MKTSLGLIGVGMMGVGIAANLVRHGFPLHLLEHPGNQPIGELLAAGAQRCATPRELAARVDDVDGEPADIEGALDERAALVEVDVLELEPGDGHLPGHSALRSDAQNPSRFSSAVKFASTGILPRR